MVDSDKDTKGTEGQEESAKDVDLTKYTPKEEVDKLTTSAAKEKEEMQSKIDQANMSLLDPDYIAFKESKNKKPEANTYAGAVDVDNMTQKQLVDHILKAVDSRVEPLTSDVKSNKRTVADVLAVIELENTQKKYSDFNDHRDTIKKIIETSEAPLTFEQAYFIAKGNKPADKTPAEPAKPGSEKPTGSVPAESLKPKDFKDESSAADDAWDKTVGAGKDTL